MYKPLEVNALKLYLLWRPLPFTGSKVVAKVSMVENFDLKASQPKSASFGEGRRKKEEGRGKKEEGRLS